MATYFRTKEFEGASFVKASLKGATLRFSDVSDVTMRAVDVNGLDIDSHDLAFGTLTVNGVDVVPLVEAELDRRFPGRELQRARTPEGLRAGWEAVQDAWRITVADTPRDLVDAHVEDEWSLAQTLRHLVLATDAWLRGAILRVPQPFHEIGQIFTGAAESGFDALAVQIDATTVAGYMPHARSMMVKIVVDRASRRLLGAQIVGREGAALRIDSFALALWNEMTVDELMMTDLGYAPPFASVWDPVQQAARAAVSRLGPPLR